MRNKCKKILAFVLGLSMVLGSFAWSGVEAKAETTAKKNLALGGQAVPGSLESGTHFYASGAIDGKVGVKGGDYNESRWSSENTTNYENKWLLVKLGDEPKTFDEFIIRWERRNVKGFQIWTANNDDIWSQDIVDALGEYGDQYVSPEPTGEDWNLVYEFPEQGKSGYAELETRFKLATAATAEYVKLKITENDDAEAEGWPNVSVWEFQVLEAEGPEIKNIYLTEGESITIRDKSGAYADDYPADSFVSDTIVDVAVNAVISHEKVTSLTDGEEYWIENNRSTTLLNNYDNEEDNSFLMLEDSVNDHPTETALWKFTAAESEWKVVDTNNAYLTIGNGSASVGGENTVSIAYNNSAGYWTLSKGNVYLNHHGGGQSTKAGGWDGDNYYNAATDDGSYWNIYKKVVENATDVTFTGETVGTTTVKVGSTVYNITVNGSANGKVVRIPVGGKVMVSGALETAVADSNIAEITVEAEYSAPYTKYNATDVLPSGKYLIGTAAENYMVTQEFNNDNDWGVKAFKLAAQSYRCGLNNSNLFNVTAKQDGYTIQTVGGEYVTFGTSKDNGNTNLDLVDTPTTISISRSGNGYNITKENYYWNNLGGNGVYGNKVAGGYTTNSDPWIFYVPTLRLATATIEGLQVGETTATIGNVTYTIHVVDYPDTAALENKISEATAKLSEVQYTQASKDALAAGISDAKDLVVSAKEGTTNLQEAQSEIDIMVTTLTNLVKQLVVMYVVDFGLPMRFDTNCTEQALSVSSANGATVSFDGGYVTYTPTQVFAGIDTVTVKYEDAPDFVCQVYPATSVYYDAKFASVIGSWSVESASATRQIATEVGDESANYGRQANYYDSTSVTSADPGNSATFTFTGTGVDVYMNCKADTGKGIVSVTVSDADGTTEKKTLVDTALSFKEGSPEAAVFENIETVYGVPVVSLDNLGHGEHTVTINHVKLANDNTSELILSGFRVYDTLETDAEAVYVTDGEANPIYLNVKDQVVASLNSASPSNIMEQVEAEAQTTVGAVILADSELGYTKENLQDFIRHSAKNELYLYPGQILAFNATPDSEVQIGLRSLNGTALYTLNDEERTMNSHVDMFYPVTVTESGTVMVKNRGEQGVLAITKLKVPGVAAASFSINALTRDTVAMALATLGYEPGDSGDTEEPKVSVTDKFTDVAADDWFADEVQYVFERGIMTGIDETTFAPNEKVTRATIVQALYKLEGKPAVSDFEKYEALKDHQDNIWWKDAVAWGVNTGVVKGDSTTQQFNSDDVVTREDLATFIYRYAKDVKKLNVELTKTADEILSDTSINSWAKEAFAWAVENNLIKGQTTRTGSDLAPQAGATRAELATIMMRFYEKYNL